MINGDTKLTISKGCVDYLVEDLERSRKRIEILSAKTEVMDNFFGMVNRLGPKMGEGHSPCRLHQAKKEIEEAIFNIKEKTI